MKAAVAPIVTKHSLLGVSDGRLGVDIVTLFLYCSTAYSAASAIALMVRVVDRLIKKAPISYANRCQV